MNFSAAVTEALAMARQLPRTRAQGKRATKRPSGGRPNPCASHREPSHPLAEIARISGGRPAKRQQQIRKVTKPSWEIFAEAVVSGQIAVGVPFTAKEIAPLLPGHLTGGLPMLALQLSSNKTAVRINELGDGKWTARLV